MKIKYTQNIFLIESNSERTNREKKLKRQNKKKKQIFSIQNEHSYMNRIEFVDNCDESEKEKQLKIKSERKTFNKI